MLFILVQLLSCVLLVRGATTIDKAFKDQYCTDPRTMRKHNAYTEWADAYSCTRHRCQPGGRNLAIYTVGCKRVEAPESAIECEEVVEDTNMQFPFCCTRLRCLVVVRGEVWTRVLGQPWETLPAAPWSHMYKMKKPPPADGTFLPKDVSNPASPASAGPIYELAEPSPEPHDKVLRSKKDCKDCNEPQPRAGPAPPPDIVVRQIALSTNSDSKKHKSNRAEDTSNSRHKRIHKPSKPFGMDIEDQSEPRNEIDAEEPPLLTEKVPEVASDERYNANPYVVTKPPKISRPKSQYQQVSWTEIPQSQWNEPVQESEPSLRSEPAGVDQRSEFSQEEKKNEEKPTNLQALVDAIGTRMRDIENVVQRMSDKVHPKDSDPDSKTTSEVESKHHKADTLEVEDPGSKLKKPLSDEHYKRFSVRNRGSKYLHSQPDITTEPPLFVEDTNMNGYFSDASNSVLRRATGPKEPAATYMAAVDTRRKTHVSPESDEKHKKHSHKKKKSKKGHRKHHEKKKFNKVNSGEMEKNTVSIEDNSGLANK